MSAALDYLPRGNTLSDEAWQRRHRLLQGILAAHIPGLFLFGVLRGYPVVDVTEVLALPLACLIVGHLLRSRRPAAAFVTLGLVYCSAALVGLSDGAIEAHFHFFITIGFIALYQDWVPFLLNVLFTVISHGVGSSLVPDLMFNHASAQDNPWGWSLIHGVAVLAACVGVVVFWKSTEDEQARSSKLTRQLADVEIGQRRFTSDLLVNLARRNQNLLYRQLDLLNQLEDKEHDPDALADLFRLDHLATRIRRNAESLLVLSGEGSPRTWRQPVPLADVMRAAIAEIEDLDRVDDSIDESLSVAGRSVAGLTHLFAELLENAVHFSPPGVTVALRCRPLPQSPGAHLVTVGDCGVGMTPQELAEANETLRAPREVDLSVSQRLGLHVVARLAQRYGISVELAATPGGGVTAAVLLPATVFQLPGGPALTGVGARTAPPARAAVPASPDGPASAGRPESVGAAGPTPPPESVGAAGPTPPPESVGAAGPTPPPVRPAPTLPTGHPSGPVPQLTTATPPTRALAGFTPPTGDRLGAAPPTRERPGFAAPAGVPGSSAAGLGGVPPLPRRGPGESLARTRLAQPFTEPFTEPFTDAPSGLTARSGPDQGPDVGARRNDGWSSWWDRATPPEPRRPEPDRPEPDRPEPDRPEPRRPEPRRPGAGAADPRPGEPGPDRNGKGPRAPIPLPEPRPPVDDTPQLRRRVPQANLASGLHRDADPAAAPEDAAVVRDPIAARSALSRFQAAQRAAREAVEGERDGGPRR